MSPVVNTRGFVNTYTEVYTRLMPWLTTEEAAEILEYNVEYVRRLIRVGKIEAKKHGHIWLVDTLSVNRLIKTLVKQIREGIPNTILDEVVSDYSNRCAFLI